MPEIYSLIAGGLATLLATGMAAVLISAAIQDGKIQRRYEQMAQVRATHDDLQ